MKTDFSVLVLQVVTFSGFNFCLNMMTDIWSVFFSQVMKGSAASCWWTIASLSPARMEPLASAAWPGPGAIAPKVGTQLDDGFLSLFLNLKSNVAFVPQHPAMFEFPCEKQNCTEGENTCTVALFTLFLQSDFS